MNRTEYFFLKTRFSLHQGFQIIPTNLEIGADKEVS